MENNPEYQAAIEPPPVCKARYVFYSLIFSLFYWVMLYALLNQHENVLLRFRYMAF